MKIIITGARITGKTDVSKMLSEKLEMEYISLDYGEEGAGNAYNLVKDIYEKEDFVLDLSGDIFCSAKYPEEGKKIRNFVIKSSFVMGLLPSKDEGESIEYIFEKEKQLDMAKEEDKEKEMDKIKKDYEKYPLLLKDSCDVVIYVKDKNPEDIAREVLESVKVLLTLKGG